ncbi:putative vacuolar ATPase assembly integral membrane protein [Metschnikowia bicuspidata]|uniref:Putative vacuolar ATPase assembly integral membrane protein n=1 Tax=Metschnikowia bicuspidata TaxID=27322 RepID=A0A4P9ZJW5_9ASCO|nr:putative vacuolar ATPase assembly integral membrane protein [Metschnikowia bicuspidata]
MTRFLLTPDLRRLVADSELTADEKTALLSQKEISHTNLVAFYKRCCPTPSLLLLLNTTKMVPRKNTPVNPPKTKEFLRFMEWLRLVKMEHAYQQLVNPKPALGTLYENMLDEEPYNPARAHKEVRSHITTIFNIFISVASVVYAIWYWTHTSWRLRDSYRVLLCLFFGIVVLVAEVVVYMGYLNKIDAARAKERLKKEVKSVVRRVH